MAKQKFFISCAVPGRRIGAMQFECEDSEQIVKEKAEKMCPERAAFQAYGISEFVKGMPVDKFVTAKEMEDIEL